MLSKTGSLKRAKNLIPKSKNSKTISYIEMNLLEACNKASVDISIGLRNMTEEFASKGTLKSGIFVTASITLIDNTITESYKNFLNTIEALQNNWNVTFTDKTLDKISELITNRYQGLTDSVIQNSYKNIISVSNPPSRSSDLHLNTVRQNIKGRVDSKIQEIKISNKVKKDDPRVREAIKANRISVLALIVSAVSLYFSLK